MIGPRQVVQVELGVRSSRAGDRVEVELPVGERAQIGRPVLVAVAADRGLWAVSAPSGPQRETLVDVLA